jgi:hypothetical protein
MLVALELNPRQAARVMAHAIHARAQLEIEPRPEICCDLLWGTLVGGERDLLHIDLHQAPSGVGMTNFVGAACDVRIILSGELYLFSTFIVDVSDQTVPQRLILASPEVIQVANRRRHVRRRPVEPMPVRLGVANAPQAFVAELANIGLGGIACRIPPGELEALLLIGDQTELEFVLPWSGDMLNLTAVVCSKDPTPDREKILVGFEFVATDASRSNLEKLRAALTSETARLSDLHGEL